MAARVFARRIRGGAAAQVAGVPASKFDAASAPPPPDYANRDAWSALPGASTDKPADCFYIHPTAYFGDQWNASYDDAGAAAQVDQLHVGVQAAAFDESCRIFAPRYRQMTYAGFGSADVASARCAADLAYSDVKAAFTSFLETIGSRPFILASHSQGSLHATRLLLAALDGTPAASRCVAAYLIGMGIPTATADALQSFAPSTTPSQPHALVSWNLRSSATGSDARNYLRLVNGSIGFWTPAGWVDGGGPLLQTSPLTWASHHTGPPAEPPAEYLGIAVPVYEPGFLPMQLFSGDGILESKLQRIVCKKRITLTATTTPHEVVVGGLSPKLAELDMGQGPGDLHVLDYTLFFYNVRKNVAERVAAFVGRSRL